MALVFLGGERVLSVNIGLFLASKHIKKPQKTKKATKKPKKPQNNQKSQKTAKNAIKKPKIQENSQKTENSNQYYQARDVPTNCSELRVV